jgi:hypothetical protein
LDDFAPAHLTYLFEFCRNINVVYVRAAPRANINIVYPSAIRVSLSAPFDEGKRGSGIILTLQLSHVSAFDLAALEGTPEALAIEWTGSSGGAKRPRYDEIVQSRIAAITAAGEPSVTGADGSTAVVPANKATTEPEMTRRIGELETLLSELRRVSV